MTRIKRDILITLPALLLVLFIFLCGGACYLLRYALQPGDRSRNEQLAWHEMDSIYPGLKAWHDSLQAEGLWRDTTIRTTDGMPLHAYIVRTRRPHANNTTLPRTALLVHGHTDCAVRMLHIGRMYERDLGLNILVPDLRNAGRSGGTSFGMGWPDRRDMLLWTQLVPEIFGDGNATTVVHGISMGAATTMMLSGEKDVPKSVVAYVEDCGYTAVDDQFTLQLKEQFNLPAWPLIPLSSKICEWRNGWNFYEASALEQVKRCQRPMLFIHGSADDYVPTDMVHTLYAAHPGRKALWVAPGAVHARSYQKYPAEYTARVKAFLEEK